MIASSKNSPVKTDYNDETTRTRLFVVCPKDYTEDDLKDKFVQFGDFDYCNIIRDKMSGESKGFGYVKFTKASTAAMAMEDCDKSLKAILAEPKSAKFARAAAASVSRDHQRYSWRGGEGFGALGGGGGGGMALGTTSPTHSGSTMDLFLNHAHPGGGGAGAAGGPYHQANNPAHEPVSNRLYVLVSTMVGQDQLHRLFDLVPGMESCDLKRHYSTRDSRGFAYVSYNSITAAMYAKEKLNGFEYPPGSKLTVKYAEDLPTRYLRARRPNCRTRLPSPCITRPPTLRCAPPSRVPPPVPSPP